MGENIESILAAAKDASPNAKLLLTTTLNRYQMQIKMMSDLQSDIMSRGVLVPVPGTRSKKNTTPNPSVAEYARVASAANSTAKTLLVILKEMDSPLAGVKDEDDEL